MPRYAVTVLTFLASTLLGQQYPFVSIPNAPKNIEHLAEDPLGRLWLSTHDDIFCFDGARFFSLRDFGFPPALSYGLAVDFEGAILSATNLGVYRFSQGRLERILSGPKMLEIVAVAPGLLLATGSDSLPFQTLPNPAAGGNGLYRIRRSQDRWNWERLSVWKSNGPLSRDPAGNILTACPGGWCELSTNLIAEWKPGDAASPKLHPSDLTDLQRVLRDRQGCLWFRTVESGAYQCPGDAAPIRLPPAVAGRNVWSAQSETVDGSILFPNAASLAVGRPGAFRVATSDQGLPLAAVSSALQTQDGTIWIGTIEGLYRFPYPFRLEQWRSRHGLVWSFARVGARLVAGTSAGVATLDENRQWSILGASGAFGSISSLAPDGQGNFYAVLSHQGVILLSGDGRLLARTPVNQGKGAETLARTNDGEIWLAGAGIERVRRVGKDLLLDREPLPGGDLPASITLDRRNGDLWACSPNGLSRRESGRWKLLSEPGSLPAMGCSSMAAEPQGDLWLGYPSLRKLVLAQIAKGRVLVRQFDVDPAGGPYSLGIDPRGWLWRGSGDGFYAARLDQARSAVWNKLSGSDGLTNVDTNRRSFFSDSDGSIWWAADAGIVHFRPPPHLVDPTAFLPAFLSGFSVDGSAAALAGAPAAFKNVKRLIVHLGSLQFQNRDALRLRYRWLPGQNEWRTAPSLDIDLGTPTWGPHILEFQSRLATGGWSQSVSRSITVLRPWWFSWQAGMLLCTAFYAGTAGVLTWRKRRQAGRLPDLTGWRMAALSPELQWVGTILDQRFEIESLISLGGFASVLKGRDQLYHGRPCAIKIFRSEVLDRSWVTHRFQQEVAALEKIRHPSVVSIYGHGVTPEGTPYLVMEFIDGVTLRELLNLGPVPAPRAASLLLQTSAALSEIHPKGIYHRDLKPENLMIRSGCKFGEELVLIDFSIAIVKEPDKTMHGLSRAAGTFYYMAPEQAVGFACPASDVYSLAKILLEMLTGQRLSTLLPDAAMDLPERVKELVHNLPVRFSDEAVDLVASALEFDPSRRPQDAPSFANPIGRDLLLTSKNA